MTFFSKSDFKELSELVYTRFGIHLPPKKKDMVKVRLNKELRRLGISSFSKYLDYIRSDIKGNAASSMINLITTNHTFFYREKEHFVYFRDVILPEMRKRVEKGDRTLRVWSAGCSSGEEPYTLAMLMMDYFGDAYKKLDAGVLATDISSKVLKIAQEGHYAEQRLSKLPPSLKKKYFFKLSDGMLSVKPELKKEVLFKRLNLKNPKFPFKKPFDVIFCRNVMIYFDNMMREELVEKFYRHLAPGGYFFIGHSESLRQTKTLFSYIQPALYKKNS